MLKNMKLSKRLILTFTVTVLISSIATIIGVTLLSKLDTEYSDALQNYGFAQGDIGNLASDFHDHRATILYMLNTDDPDLLKEQKSKLDKQIASIEEDMTQVETRLMTPEGKETFAKLRDNLNSYGTYRTKVLAMLSTDSRAAFEYFRTDVAPVAQDVADSIDNIMQTKITSGHALSTTLSTQAATFIIIMITIIIVSIAFSIIVSIAITKGITKPINEMVVAARDLSEGKLDITIQYHANDEIGTLAHSLSLAMERTTSYITDLTRGLGEMAKGNFDISQGVTYQGDFKVLEGSMIGIIVSLSETLRQINEAADQVSSGSDQVSSGAQALSQGATQQASSIEELSATITEISQQVKDNAQNANSANDKVSHVTQEITQSNQQMQELITAMDKISASSNQIGKIIKTIEDIAFQTNILALNAAVEAARAGTAGKGFAVVADEVRNLASKSAEAAKNTSMLIGDSINAVEDGTRIADAAAQSLQTVVAGANDVSQTMDKIKKASGQQAEAIAQVTQGVDQISSVVQTNSATAEESAATSEELSGQAQVLKSLVEHFKLKDNSEFDHNEIK